MTTFTRWPRLLLGLLLAGGLAACDNNDNPDDDDGGPPPPAVPTVTLAAAPATLVQGAATTLTWSSTNATACTASGAWTGSRAVSGSESSTPAAAGTASYTLTCTGAGGSGTATAAVTVTAPPPPPPPPPPTVSLAATPTTVTLGAASTLNWSSTNATACTATGGWTGDRATSGTASVTPAATGSIPYTLTCTGPGGSAAATATVTVNPVPTLSLSAAPTAVIIGGSSTLTWSSSNTTGCTASGGWTGARAISGAETVTPAAVGDASYTLSCTGAGGTAVATTVVTVNPIPTVSLTVEGRAVSAGGPTGDGGLANARIRVTAGGMNFLGTADPSGNFSIPVTIPASEQDRLVRIFATEPSDTPVIVYVSQLASFRTLLAQAGADFTLSANENFRVNVSNVATAETALVQEAAFGFPVNDANVRAPLLAAAARPRTLPVASIATNDEELEAALMSINQTELLDIAVSLSLVADRGFALPVEIDSTLGLALTPEARQQFINTVRNGANAAVIDETLSSLLGNPEAVMGTTTATVPSVAVTGTTGAANEESLIGNGAVQVPGSYRFNADGRGSFSNGQFSSNDMTWSVNAAGVIEIRFANPPSRPFTGFRERPDGSGELDFFDCTFSLEAIDIQPLSTSTARVRNVNQTTCPDAPDLDETNVSADTALFAPPSVLPPIEPSDVINQLLGLRLASPGADRFGNSSFGIPGDLMNFAANGTGDVRALGLTFTWVIEADGALVVDYSNNTRTTYRKLRTVFEGGDLYLGEFEFAGDLRTVQFPAFRANFALNFTPENVAGSHYAAGVGSVNGLEQVDFTRSATNAEVSLLKGFAIEAFPSGLFNQVSDRLETDAEGQVFRRFSASNDVDSGRFWRIQPDGTLVFRSYLRLLDNGVTTFGDGCGFDGTGVANCFLFVERVVEPYFLYGNRQGWFERLRFFDFDGTNSVLNSECVRTTFYVRRPNGDWALPREGVSPLRQQPSSEAIPELRMQDLLRPSRVRHPYVEAIRNGRAVMN